MASRHGLAALLLALLAAGARAQSPAPPARAAWWSEPRAWTLLADRWGATEEPLVRAGLARLGWDAVGSDRAARDACLRAQGARRSPSPLLAALASAGPPPAISPWAPGEPAPDDGAGPLSEATRALALCAWLDGDEGAARLAAWQAEASPPGELAGVAGVPAARRRLAALADALPPLGRPGPAVARVAVGPGWPPEAVGWVVSATPRAWVFEDERGARSVLPLDDQVARVTLADHAVALLSRRVSPARRRRPVAEEVIAVGLGGLAYDAAEAGERWLALALLGAADAGPAASTWEALLLGRWAARRLQEAARRFRDRADGAEVLALLAPIRGRGPLDTRAAAEALAASLAPVAHEASPTWADWEAAGLEERLERLSRALDWAELDDVFPPDAPPGPDGRRPTVGGWLERSGWSGIPLRLERLDDQRLLRAAGPGPGGLLRVADVARASPYGLERGRRGAQQAWAARAWWEEARPLGAAAWWQAHLVEVVDRRPDALPLLATDLGPAAAPRLLALLGDGVGRRLIPRRARCLTAAAELACGDFAAELLRAREEEEPRLALAGAAGLARLEAAGVTSEAAPRPALERLRATVRWLVSDRAPTALQALRALEPEDLALAGELTRALGARRYEDQANELAALCVPGETLDRRLALCRLVALLEAGDLDDGDPDELAETLVAWRSRARRGPPPPDELRELLAPFALEVLADDAPLWRDDPPRRDHAVTTAALLGPEVADALSARAGLDVRALVAARLAQPDLAGAAAAREELAGAERALAWLCGSEAGRAAVRLLEGPEPGPRLWLGAVTAQAELPEPLRARAAGLARREVVAGTLVDLVRAWAEDPAGPPALRLQLHHAAWEAVTLELSVATPADWPRTVVEARTPQRVLFRQTVDGAPATQARRPLAAAVQALSERYRTGASATLVLTR